MTLRDELEAFRAAFMQKADPAVRALMEESDRELAESGLADRALKAGDAAPDFDLPDARGGSVRLSALLAEGPVAISFYRGGWCPYCNLELRALQRALPEIEKRGGRLVAISPETPDRALTTADKNELAFAVLSDRGSKVAAAYGVAFELHPALRPVYDRFGHALPSVNGSSGWTLPIPATFVVAPDGKVALASVVPDYRTRLEPAEVVSAIGRAASGAEGRES